MQIMFCPLHFCDFRDQEQPPEEQQEEEEEAPEEELIADIPELPALNPADLYLVSLPNFLHVNPKPFDPNTYEGEDDENEHDNENENDDNFNRIKLKVENTIRWRPRNGVAITADNIMVKSYLRVYTNETEPMMLECRN